MLRANHLVRAESAHDVHCVDTVTLDRASRWRRRIVLKTDAGREILLDLAEPTLLAHGDVLALDDGSHVKVLAAAESLLEIHAHDATALARIAWHIGNRHTPCEITPSALYIQPDHVLADMIAGLGGHVHDVLRPFDPEGGAYGHKGALVESHHHGHSHHDHGHHGHHHSHHHHDDAPRVSRIDKRRS